MFKEFRNYANEKGEVQNSVCRRLLHKFVAFKLMGCVGKWPEAIWTIISYTWQWRVLCLSVVRQWAYVTKEILVS